MNYNIVQLLMAVLVLCIGLVFKLFPPKFINYSYGYRTGLSMKNADTWATGNKISSNLLIKGSLLVIFLRIICMCFLSKFPVLDTIIFLVSLITTLILCAVLTQKKLKKIFNTNGERY